MHIQSILVLFLAVFCVYVSAQKPDCNRIFKSCVSCKRAISRSNDINNVCRSRTKARWIWRNQTQCDIQRISCENPGQKMNCDNIARLAKMRPRPLIRPHV